jgi:hypothetical protein
MRLLVGAVLGFTFFLSVGTLIVDAKYGSDVQRLVADISSSFR